MCGCWAYDPVQRPNFSTLVNAIGESLAIDAEYFIMSPTSTSLPLIPEDTNEAVSLCKGSHMELNFSNLQALELTLEQDASL